MTDTFGQPYGQGQLPEKGTKPEATKSFDDDLLVSLANKDSLAAALTKQGRCDEAETLLRGVLETRETLGESRADPNMLRTMNNLAGVLNGQDRFTEAEALHRQVLESDEQSLGSEHPDTIVSMTNLSHVLTRQDKLEEAERLQRRALESSQKVHGPGNHETLSAMSGLEEILLRLHKNEQAEQMSRGVLELREKLLNKRESFDEDEDLQRQKINFGDTDTEKMTKMSGQVKIFASRGRYDEAEHLQQDLVKLSTKALGRNSGKTQATMSQLGDILIRNEKYKEAEATYREVLGMGTA